MEVGICYKRGEIKMPKALREERYGEGCPLSSQPGSLRSIVSSPSGVQGRAPVDNVF